MSVSLGVPLRRPGDRPERLPGRDQGGLLREVQDAPPGQSMALANPHGELGNDCLLSLEPR